MNAPFTMMASKISRFFGMAIVRRCGGNPDNSGEFVSHHKNSTTHQVLVYTYTYEYTHCNLYIYIEIYPFFKTSVAACAGSFLQFHFV